MLVQQFTVGTDTHLVCDNTRLGLVLEGFVGVEQLQQLISTQVTAALVHCLTVQESPLQSLHRFTCQII